MGVLSDFKAWFINQKLWNVETYDAWALKYAESFLQNHHPGMTVGPTYEFDPNGLPGQFMPVVNGDNPGEMYLSNDRTPPWLYIWNGTRWWRILTYDWA